MGVCLSSVSKDEASKLYKTALYLRHLLAALAIPCVILIIILGAVFLIVGAVVGATTHWSGILVGGILFISCVAGAVMFWDLWGTVSVGLSMFELASCPKDELVQKLQKYKERNQTGKSDDIEAADEAIRNMCEGVADTILSKFTMAFQWAPLLFTALATLCCILSVVIEDVPKGLLIASIIGSAVGSIASVCGIIIMCCILKPIVEGHVKAAIDPYVESLQKKLAADEMPVAGVDSAPYQEDGTV